jgi:hypothetical protein
MRNNKIINDRHQYGKVEDIMDMTDEAESGKIVNIKENF